MNSLRGLIKVSLIYLSRGLQIGLVFLLQVVIVRAFGVDDYGRYSFIVSYSAVFICLVNLGLEQYLLREVSVARNRAQTAMFLRNASALVGLAALFYIPIGVIVFVVMPGGEGLLVIVLLALLGALVSAIRFNIRGIYYANRIMGVETVSVVVENALIFVSCLLLLFWNIGVVWLFAFVLAARLVSLAINVLVFRRLTGWAFPVPFASFSWRECKAMLKQTTPFGINAIASMVYLNGCTLILGWTFDKSTVGYFEAAHVSIKVFTVLIVAINIYALPDLTRYFDSQDGGLGRLHLSTFKLALLISLPLAFVLMSSSKPLIAAVYDSDMPRTVGVLQLIAVLLPLRFLNNTIATLLTACGRQAVRTKVITFAAGLNIVLCFLLIPRMAETGAVVSLLITDMVILLLLLFSLPTRSLAKRYAFTAAPFLAATGAGCAAAFFFGGESHGVRLALFSVLFALALFLLDREAKGFAMRMMRSVGSVGRSGR